MRAIKEKAPPFDKLNLPEVVERLTYLPRGLILVTGDTGSGKSTTLASMIDMINPRYSRHIITLEDPVEYSFVSDKCVIEQCELGDDTPSFTSGLPTGSLDPQSSQQAAQPDPDDPDSPQPLGKIAREQIPYRAADPHDFYDRPVYRNIDVHQHHHSSRHKHLV